MAEKHESVRELVQRPDKGEERVDYDHYDPELRRSHLGVCESELFLKMGIDADIDGKQEIYDQNHQSEREMHQA